MRRIYAIIGFFCFFIWSSQLFGIFLRTEKEIRIVFYIIRYYNKLNYEAIKNLPRVGHYADDLM